jgi:Transposase
LVLAARGPTYVSTRQLFGGEEATMSRINERCTGIDVGKRFLLCCVLTGAAQDEPRSQTRRFDATVKALVRMREWLTAENVTHVVMESTGSYWIPVFNILEGEFVVVLANPEQVKTRKGHKTVAKMPSIWQTYCGTTTSGQATSRPNRCVSCAISLAGACN